MTGLEKLILDEDIVVDINTESYGVKSTESSKSGEYYDVSIDTYNGEHYQICALVLEPDNTIELTMVKDLSFQNAIDMLAEDAELDMSRDEFIEGCIDIIRDLIE